MKFIVLVSFLLVSVQAFAGEVLILSLKQVEKDNYSGTVQVVAQVNVYTCEGQEDPNSLVSGCGYRFEVDGKTVQVPPSVFLRLNQLRRGFSYDQEILHSKGNAFCRMGGPAKGLLLEARYLTFKDYEIVKSEMKPVFNVPLNCLYAESYLPKENYVRGDARAVLEILNTVKEISSSEKTE